jgi:hypothetical protein
MIMSRTSLIIVLVALGLRLAGVDLAAYTRLAEWTFDQAVDLQGWQPNGHLADVVITNGAMSFRAVGSDPILEYRASLNLPTTPWQAVEIRLRADSSGTAELFWSNTSTGRYGGFTQEKTTRFNVCGDKQWHTYRLLPSWHREGKIVRLRFDVYDGARFDLSSIRIVELALSPAGQRSEFDFNKGLGGWQRLESLGDNEASPARAGGRMLRCGTGFLLGPPVQINSANHTFVSIRMTVDRGHHGTLFFATDAHDGLQKHIFPLRPDGQEHTYNLDMLQAQCWSGTVLTLGVQLSNDTNAIAVLSQLKVGNQPEGPPQLGVVAFALEEALPRVGSPTALTAIIANKGAADAKDIQAEIQLPPGFRLIRPSTAKLRVPRLGFDEEKSLTWKVQATRPTTSQAQLKLAARGANSARAEATLHFTARPSIPPAGYVPEPKPVRGPYEVGAYYFPGWKTASQWEPLRRFPERKPVLGWYQEGSPEVADWHIKWAVEHGITFFAYDWYWSKGARQLEHALHEGYFKARYRKLLKFCLLWANHNPPASSSHEDCIAVTRYWIENYFRCSEHLLFDGRPVVIIFAPDRLTQDLGSEGTRRAFQAMRAECQAAGLPGLYLIACVSDAGGARRAVEEGYDSVTAYNWPGLGMTGEGMFGPFDALVEGYRLRWEQLADQGGLPLVPLPVCGGWDSRPWHGENDLVRFGRTPELFQQHLVHARRFLESSRSKPGTPKAILIEAWNEWGEGSYVEPHAEFVFGYLDALRGTLSSVPPTHTDVTPADARLGPYDVVPAEPGRTAWTFAEGENAWNNTMQLDSLRVADGVLSARTIGSDPAFFGPGIRAAASDFAAVVIRMRLSRTGGRAGEDSGQLFWRTTSLPECESTSTRFPVQIDESWHDYRIPVANNPRWRGTVTRLRLDPVNQPDILIDISRIALSR